MLYSNVALLWSIFCWCHGLVLTQDVMGNSGQIWTLHADLVVGEINTKVSFDIMYLQNIMYDVSVTSFVK